MTKTELENVIKFAEKIANDNEVIVYSRSQPKIWNQDLLMMADAILYLSNRLKENELDVWERSTY